MSRVVTLAELPQCDFCKRRNPSSINLAIWDAPTHYGPWAYMCNTHFELESSVAASSNLANRLIAAA